MLQFLTDVCADRKEFSKTDTFSFYQFSERLVKLCYHYCYVGSCIGAWKSISLHIQWIGRVFSIMTSSLIVHGKRVCAQLMQIMMITASTLWYVNEQTNKRTHAMITIDNKRICTGIYTWIFVHLKLVITQFSDH